MTRKLCKQIRAIFTKSPHKYRAYDLFCVLPLAQVLTISKHYVEFELDIN